MKMHKTLAAPALCLIVAGCMGPRPQVPGSASVTAPAKWLTDPGPAGDPLPNWWESLGDPVLSALVQRAIANNTDVLTAASRVQEADAKLRLARSAQWPTVGFSFLGIPRDRTYSTTTGAGISFSGYEAELAVSYDADLFGRLASQTKSARATLLGTRAAADAVRIATIASTVEDYVTLRAYDASEAVIEATLRSRQEEFALVTHRAALGYVQQVSVSEAAAEVHSTQQQLAQAQMEVATEEYALSILLGDNPSAIPRGRALLDLPLLASPTTLPAKLLRRRPDIYEAEQAIVAADHSLDSARAAFMPDLQISVTGDRLGADLLPSPLWLYAFMGTVLAPVFEGGKLRAGEDIAAAERDQAAFAYRSAALGAFQEVEDSLISLQKLTEKERAVVAQENDETIALKSARHRFAEGYSSYEEVLDAERGLFSAQTTLVVTREDRLNAMVKLYQAMGGGWSGLKPSKPSAGPL